MTVDDVLDAYAKATPGVWIVRKKVDDTGDYAVPYYDVLALFQWGLSCIGSADSQPYNAILFAGARLLCEEVSRLRAENAMLLADISDKTEARIKEAGK